MKVIPKLFLIILFLLCVLTVDSSFASSKIQNLRDFKSLQIIVEKINKPRRTLVVLDNDDTMTMMPCNKLKPLTECQYLGGPSWFNWQKVLLADYTQTQIKSPHLVATHWQQLVDISSILFTLNNMAYTDLDIPVVLDDLANKGIRFLVSTDRGINDLSASNEQFKNLLTESGNLLDLLDTNTLSFQSNTALPSPYFPCNISGTRAVAYSQGTLYNAGQNKGMTLTCLLNKYENESISRGEAYPIDTIIFVDDVMLNVKNVHHSFAKNKNYNVISLHYTALQEHKSALLTGKHKITFQKQATQRWNAIKSVMKSSLIQPNL